MTGAEALIRGALIRPEEPGTRRKLEHLVAGLIGMVLAYFDHLQMATYEHVRT